MPREEKSQFWIQYGAAIVASITAAGYGSIMSWTSPALPYLKSDKSYLLITKNQISWIAPLLPIGIIIGNFLNPIFIDRIGRKWTLLMFAVPQIISWLLILLTKNYKIIYLARILGGIGYGGGICAVIVYLSEIGNRKNRGIFLAFVKFSASFGIFITILLGAYLPYYYMNLGLLIMPIIFVVTFFFMPDSSYFWEKNNQIEQIKLNNSITETEKSKLNEKVQEADSEDNLKNNSIKKENSFEWKDFSFWKLLTIPSNLRGLMIIFCVTAQDSFSGHTVLIYFSQQMLTYKGSLLPPEKGALVFATVKLFASVIATQVIERFGRKTLLLSTGMLASFTQVIIGIFFYLENCKVDVSSFAFLPFLGFLIYEIASTIGSSNLFYIFQGEFFQNDVKGMAVTASKIFHMFIVFLSVVMYQILVERVSTYVIFFIFSISGAVMCFVSLSILPETKGKSLNEIQVLLGRSQRIQSSLIF